MSQTYVITATVAPRDAKYNPSQLYLTAIMCSRRPMTWWGRLPHKFFGGSKRKSSGALFARA